jgi:hypothetical protein
MSATDNNGENWILIQSRYDYIALPATMAVEVLKSMRIVSKSGNKIELAGEGASFHVISHEQMCVAIAKSKMLPKEGEE